MFVVPIWEADGTDLRARGLGPEGVVARVRGLLIKTKELKLLWLRLPILPRFVKAL